MNKCVNIGAKKFDVFVANGVAKGAANHSDQSYHVGYSVLGGGNFLNSTLSKSTNFFLIGDDGREDYVAIDATLPMRDGHRIRVLFCGEPTSGSGYPIAVLNETTGKTVVTPAAEFQNQFRAIGQASWLIRILISCLIIVGGIAIWLMTSIPNTQSQPITTLAGWSAVVAFAYMMYEGLIGIHFWSANRIRRLHAELAAITANELHTKA
jgi:hypothetical protein